MATATLNLVYTKQAPVNNWSTDGGVAFQTWGQALSNALKSLLTQTADTGQISFAAVPAAPATTGSNLVGYEMYRFNDALQASAPIFIRIRYYVMTNSITAGATAYYAFLVAVTIGTATDGAGNFVGTSTTTVVVGHGGQNSGTTSSSNYSSGDATTTPPTRPYYISAGDGYFNLATAYGGAGAISSNANMRLGVGFFGVERTRSATTGAMDGRGVIFTALGSTLFLTSSTTGVPSLTGFMATSPAPTRTGLVANGGPIANQGYHSSFAFGADLYFMPAFMATPEACGQPVSWLGYISSDISAQTQLSVSIYGVARNYLCLGSSGGLGWAMGGDATVQPTVLAMRFD